MASSQRNVLIDRQIAGCEACRWRSRPHLLGRICLTFQGSMSARNPAGELSNGISMPFLGYFVPKATRSKFALRIILRRTWSAANGSAIHTHPHVQAPPHRMYKRVCQLWGETKGFLLAYAISFQAQIILTLSITRATSHPLV